MENELAHFKYTRRYRKNGKWVYIYGDKELHKEYKSALKEYKSAVKTYNKAAKKLNANKDSGYRQANLKRAAAATKAAYEKVSKLDVRNDRVQKAMRKGKYAVEYIGSKDQ